MLALSAGARLFSHMPTCARTGMCKALLKMSDCCVPDTQQVPDTLAPEIVNVTATGQSYITFNFKNVTTTKTFQV